MLLLASNCTVKGSGGQFTRNGDTTGGVPHSNQPDLKDKADVLTVGVFRQIKKKKK